MLERRLVAELDSAPLIVLDPSAPASDEALDMAVRAAASLCVWLAHDGGCSILLPGDRRPIEVGHDLGAWPAVHVRLALVEEGPAPPASTLGPRGGAVVWVTGADLARAPRTLERLPAGARYVVTPGALPGAPPGLRGRGLHRLPRRARAQGRGGVSSPLGPIPGAGHRGRGARGREPRRGPPRRRATRWWCGCARSARWPPSVRRTG